MNAKFFKYFFPFLLIVSSCSTSTFFREEMLPDGTWKMSFPLKKQSSLNPRKAFEQDEEKDLPTEEVSSSFKTQAQERASQLCPNEKFRVFGCRVAEQVICYIKCN